MSYTLHHAIIVTARYDASISQPGTPSEHWIERAHRKARELFRGIAEITEPTAGPLNDVRSFLVAPDGSSESWDESDLGDRARAEFVDWLRAQSYGINEDGEWEGSPLAWVEVEYADESGAAPRILADAEDSQRWT